VAISGYDMCLVEDRNQVRSPLLPVHVVSSPSEIRPTL
jgi:hypothetical protein